MAVSVEGASLGIPSPLFLLSRVPIPCPLSLLSNKRCAFSRKRTFLLTQLEEAHSLPMKGDPCIESVEQGMPMSWAFLHSWENRFPQLYL